MLMASRFPSVLMVLDSVFPAVGGGGAESQVRTLSLELLARGIPVSVVVPMAKHGPQLAHENVDGIPVRRLAYPKLPLFGAAWMLFSLACLLVRSRHRYDVIHSHIAGNMSAVCCVVGRLLDKPVLVKLTGMTEMRGGILDSAPGAGARIRRVAIGRADSFQATSSRIAALLVARGFSSNRVRLIPNAVDTRRFAYDREDLALKRSLCGACRVTGIYVGRLEAEKGLETLLQGWAKVFHGRNDAVLLIVGGGSSRADLQSMAESLGIASQIRFLGATGVVEKYLQLADFGVLTSLHEGLSNTLLEYMAAGLPVLGSRVSGTEDFVINGQTGWLFSPGDIEAFADSLLHASNAGAEELCKLGQQAREFVVGRASIAAVVDQLLLVYGQRG